MFRHALFISCLLGISTVQADDLLHALDHASAGMRLQSERMKVIAQNIANGDSTGVTPGALPYRRKILIAKNKWDKARRLEKVAIGKLAEDPSDFNIKYSPNHPAADERGYLLLPNVNRTLEMQDAKEAQRSYEANVSAMEISKSMITKTIDLIK